MAGFLICSSLRRRSDWASLPSALVSSKTARWQETKLDTHDVALPLPLPPTAAAPLPRVLRAIFLVPEDVGSEATQARLERLYRLNGGEDVVVVFLLKHRDGRENPMATLMRLQQGLVGDFEMPVIPVDSIKAVPTALLAFHRRLSTSSSRPKLANPVHSILPYCSNTHVLSEHAVNVLTDVTSDFRDMLDKMSSPAGREMLEEYLDGEARKAISFWTEEFLVD